MQLFAVAGLGFGDESKGGLTDFLAREYEPSWIIRYNGGAQAGHNVVLPDGHSHCFSQYGAGTFANNGVKTYLSQYMIVDPLALYNEQEALRSNDSEIHKRLFINPNCLVVTPYHAALNRLRELSRNKRHGSCGRGIGETKKYWLDYGQDAVFVKDLCKFNVLYDKLELLRERLLHEAQQLEIGCYTEYFEVLINGFGRKLYRDLTKNSFIMDTPCLNENDSIIFEGAQGFLLDQVYGFYPYTSWSDCTFNNVDKLCDEFNIKEPVEKIGVIRSYYSRHGEGPFPTEDFDLTQKLGEMRNPHNNWQGKIRYGYFDLSLFRYALKHCNPDCVAITCLDQYPGKISSISRNAVEKNEDFSLVNMEKMGKYVSCLCPNIVDKAYMNQESFLKLINSLVEVKIESHGPTYKDKKVVNYIAN